MDDEATRAAYIAVLVLSIVALVVAVFVLGTVVMANAQERPPDVLTDTSAVWRDWYGEPIIEIISPSASKIESLSMKFVGPARPHSGPDTMFVVGTQPPTWTAEDGFGAEYWEITPINRLIWLNRIRALDERFGFQLFEPTSDVIDVVAGGGLKTLPYVLDWGAGVGVRLTMVGDAILATPEWMPRAEAMTNLVAAGKAANLHEADRMLIRWDWEE